MPDQIDELRVEAIKGMAKIVPEFAWESTIAIVIEKNGQILSFASGILFRVGSKFFAITAAHVIEDAHKLGKTLGIALSSGVILAPSGDWMCTQSGQYGFDDDPFDIAILLLPEETVDRIGPIPFLDLGYVDFNSKSTTGVYALFGFPGKWASVRGRNVNDMKAKALQYTTVTFFRGSEILPGYKERFHLALDAQLSHGFDLDGEQAEFEDLKGSELPFPAALGGISGCSIWRIGDYKIPPTKWRDSTPKLVAIQTGVYREQEAIIGTRWIAVNTLFHEAFPGIRPDLKSIDQV